VDLKILIKYVQKDYVVIQMDSVVDLLKILIYYIVQILEEVSNDIMEYQMEHLMDNIN